MPGACTDSGSTLAIRPGGIGDTILTLPAIEHLKPGEIWVRSEIVPLVRGAFRVRSIASTGVDLLGIPGVEPPPGLVASLRRFSRIDSWYGATRPEFRDALAGLCDDVRFHAALPAEGFRGHAADFFLSQVGGHGAAIPAIATGPVERRRSIVFHPYSGSARKNWPMERWIRLEQELGGVEWAESPDGTRFEDLLELARWIAGASLYVGNDSGITHLAAAAGARVIALFGPTDPEVWAPRGEKIRVVRAASMEEISIAMVREAVEQQLQQLPR